MPTGDRMNSFAASRPIQRKENRFKWKFLFGSQFQIKMYLIPDTEDHEGKQRI